jgi:Phospholipase_D-nuclease N-terminal
MFLNFSAFVSQLLSFLLLAFWLWMFIDYLFSKALDSKSRIIWGFVLLLIPFGAIPYYCLGRSQHNKLTEHI